MINIELENIYNSINNLYNMDGTTWQEVLATLYNKVASTENKFSILENKFGLILPQTVKTEIQKLVGDGTLSNIINTELLADINNKVDLLKQELQEESTNVYLEMEEVKTSIKSAIEDITIKLEDYYIDNWDNAFIKAFAVIEGLGGGTLLLPNKDIYITSTIKIPSNTIIKNLGGTIISNGIARPFENSNKDTGNKNITIDGLIIDCSLNTGTQSNTHGLNFHNVDGLVIRNCMITNAKGDGIYIGANDVPCKNVVIENNTIKDWGRMGIAVTSADGVLINNNKIVYTLATWKDNSGIDIEPNNATDLTNNITITNNILEGCCINLYGKNTEEVYINDVKLLNNTILNSDKVGILGNRIKSLIVEGNNINNSTLEGITLQFTTAKIIHNTFTSCKGDAVVRLSTCDNSIISSNLINNNTKSGIKVITSKHVSICDNIVNSTLMGVELYTDVKYTVVSGNICKDTITGGIGIMVWDNGATGCKYINIVNNQCIDDRSIPVQKYGIRSTGLTDNLIVSNNVCLGTTSSKIALIGSANINNNNM